MLFSSIFTTSSSDSITDPRPHVDLAAWTIVRKFAGTEMSLPNAESDLQAHLGDRYTDSDWRPALKAVMDTEGDTDLALRAVNTLEKAAFGRTGLKLRIPAHQQKLAQLSAAEQELMGSINGLKERKRIFGTLLTIDEILDPAEERDNGDLLNFEGGDKAIADEVRCEIAVVNGEVVEIDSDDESEEDGPSFTRAELLKLRQQLETGCMQHGDPQFSLNLTSQLRLFRAKLRREELLNAKQTSIDCYFKA